MNASYSEPTHKSDMIPLQRFRCSTLHLRLAENILIITSIALTIAALVHNAFETADFLADLLTISLFFYTKIPSRLNSYFHTEVFRRDLSIRMGLVFFPTLIFFLFSLNIPLGFFLLPERLEPLKILSMPVSVLAVLAVSLLSIVYFSWRVWNCSDVDLGHSLWRKACASNEDYKRDIALSKISRIDRLLSTIISPGVAPMAIVVILFFSMLVLMIADVLLVLFLLCWLIYNVLYEVRKRSTSFRRRSNLAYGFFLNLDKILAWDSLLRTGLAGRTGGVIEVIILMGCFSILFLSSIASTSAILVMFGFLGQWYVLVILIQIARRTTLQRQRSRRWKNSLLLPYRSDIVLAFCLATLLVFSLTSYINLQESMMFVGAFAMVSLILNTTAIWSVVRWVKSNIKTSEEDFSKGLERDRYRLWGIFYSLGLFIVSVGRDLNGFVFWSAFSGGLIFLTTYRRLRLRLSRSGAKTYATITTLHTSVGVYLVLGAAAFYFSELLPLMVVVSTLCGILLLLMWLQEFRIRSV